MCMPRKEPSGGESSSSSSSSFSSSSSSVARPYVPAKRTKFFRVYRGVRRAGRGRWASEVRRVRARSSSSWLRLGTFESAETAARAHDAATLALRGSCSGSGSHDDDDAWRLNFADSDWLLDVPPPSTLRTAGDVQRAVARAVEGFLQLQRWRRDGGGSAPALDVDDAMSATSEPTAAATQDDNEDDDTEATSATSSTATTQDYDDDATEASSSSATVVAAPACTVDDDFFDVEESSAASPFERDVVCDMGRDLYYASLAEALLMEPPASDDASTCREDGGGGDCDGSGAPLWGY